MKQERQEHQEITPIDWEIEAVVARFIGNDGNGSFIDTESGLPADDLLGRFSLMKYGHLPSAAYFSREIAKRALASDSFLNFIRNAREKGQAVFITSPGVFNVPSASNLLLKETVTLLNIACSRSGLPPIKLVEQIRLEESGHDYAQRSIADRKRESQGRSIIPEVFRGGAVIYLDDVYISGTVAERAKQRLIGEVGADQTFFLFGMRVDPQLVQESDGKVEDFLNRFVVDGSLRGLLPVISDRFIPTQKTLRDLLHPDNRSDLPNFISTLDPDILYTLYSSALQNGFRERWKGIYKESIEIIETFLESLGYLSWLCLTFH